MSCTDANGYLVRTNYSGEFVSLTIQKEWFCEDKFKASNFYAAGIVGSVISMMVGGQLGDKLVLNSHGKHFKNNCISNTCRYGRKNVVFGSLAINIVLRIISVFIVEYNYYLLLAVIALGTTFSPMGIRLAVTLVAEYCDSRGRFFNYISDWVFWVTGTSVLPIIAWLCHDWFTYRSVELKTNSF